ncbi:hypothetical protein J2W14_002697 [Pseudarthrobacter oxydans]|uniref:hypothetical protein n=1 Tax=Pseudarthrobacter oxydans TaxID=1671 RepID=UPI00277EDC02|nr:hypothetical protein [Pseudarthrobacter oxydans]MDP9983284.1 hypothetical protein [Pseudarthrobacter oxydans]
MTRPDPNSADSSANQDDAVWLDLVARLEGRDTDAAAGPVTAAATEGTGGPEARHGREGSGAVEGAEGSDAPGTDDAPAADPAGSGPRPFSDFDPLGLSVGVPIELSAEERQEQRHADGSPAAGAAADRPGAAPGPRDYEGAEDDPLGPGEFVPEEPPSLAGTDPLTVLAWLGAVGGPVALLISAMFWRSAPLMAILGMVAAFAASVVFLIMKLPGEKDEHDDGARI